VPYYPDMITPGVTDSKADYFAELYLSGGQKEEVDRVGLLAHRIST